MRKQKSIRWFRYTVEDAKAAQAELDEQAERGWELEEVGLFTATFRRAERPRGAGWSPPVERASGKRTGMPGQDYLTLCGEAGWELLEEDGGLFYFRAKEGTDPAPLQTDEDVEWADVWKKALADQVDSSWAKRGGAGPDRGLPIRRVDRLGLRRRDRPRLPQGGPASSTGSSGSGPTASRWPLTN